MVSTFKKNAGSAFNNKLTLNDSSYVFTFYVTFSLSNKTSALLVIPNYTICYVLIL